MSGLKLFRSLIRHPRSPAERIRRTSLSSPQRSMAWYLDGSPEATIAAQPNLRTEVESSPSIPAAVADSNYEDDISQIFIALNNSGEPGSGSGGSPGTGGVGNAEGNGVGGIGGNDIGDSGGNRGKARYENGRRGRTEAEGPRSPRSAGALADYFSSLFDESFCSHKFKLVG